MFAVQISHFIYFETILIRKRQNTNVTLIAWGFLVGIMHPQKQKIKISLISTMRISSQLQLCSTMGLAGLIVKNNQLASISRQHQTSKYDRLITLRQKKNMQQANMLSLQKCNRVTKYRQKKINTNLCQTQSPKSAMFNV